MKFFAHISLICSLSPPHTHARARVNVFYLPPIDFTIPLHHIPRAQQYIYIQQWTRPLHPKNISYKHALTFLRFVPSKWKASIDIDTRGKAASKITKELLTFDPSFSSNRLAINRIEIDQAPFRSDAAIREARFSTRIRSGCQLTNSRQVFFKWNALRSPQLRGPLEREVWVESSVGVPGRPLS